MDRIYRATVVVLLAALVAAVIVQGNRIIRMMPYTPITQDVRVVNGERDRVPVTIEREPPVTIEGAAQRARMEQEVQGWASPKRDTGMSPAEQQVFDRVFGTTPAASSSGSR